MSNGNKENVGNKLQVGRVLVLSKEFIIKSTDESFLSRIENINFLLIMIPIRFLKDSKASENF